MAVPTDTLELAKLLIECDLPREHAETLAIKLSEKSAQAASEDDLSQQLAVERERSDARFEQQLAASNARFDAMLQQMNARFDQRDAGMNARFDQRDAEMNARFAQIDARFAELEVKVYRAVAAGTALILAAISVWAAFG